jgi:hypothetical protein
MSVLKSLESKLAGLVEGTFSRAFKSEVRPVEIARKLARELDQNKVVSVSRTYVPNEYTVWLSERDRQQFSGYEDDLRDELSAYLLEHARRERVAFLTRPEISFETDDRLRLGEFGIQARLVRPDEAERSGGVVRGEAGHTSVYSTAKRIAEPLAEATEGRRGRAQLRLEGRATILTSSGAVMGRSRDCEVVVSDENVSRRHAEVRTTGSAWAVRDLGSTNGVKVNGRRIDGSQTLRPGDVIQIGLSEITFEEN